MNSLPTVRKRYVFVTLFLVCLLLVVIVASEVFLIGVEGLGL